MSIAAKFHDRANSLVYPSISDENYDSKIANYRAAQGEITKGFAEELKEAYLYQIPSDVRDAVAAETFGFAWASGHSGGYGEIESHYSEAAEFAAKIYSLTSGSR